MINVIRTSLIFGLILVPMTVSAENLFLEPYVPFDFNARAEAVAIGDVNNDSRNDVVVTTWFSSDSSDIHANKLFVFYQGADGNLSEPYIHSLNGVSNRPVSVDIGDINNDGLHDVVVGNYENLQLFLQTPDGELDYPTVYPTSHALKIRVGDLNNDQLQDIAGIEWGGVDTAVILQDEQGELNPELFHYAPHGGYDDLELGDVNSDGLLDIIVMSGQGFDDNLAILIQNKNGDFNPVSFYDLGGNELTGGVTVGDFNGDDRNDVAVTYGGNKPNSFIGIFYQNEVGELNPAVSYPSLDIPEPIQSVDINSDGLDDLVVLHGGWSKMGVYLQTSDGSLAPEDLYPIPYASHYNPHALTAGDINGDLEPDVVISDYNNGLVVLQHVTSNAPPSANAGPDEFAVQKTVVTLDGNRSNDPDGMITSYLWEQVSGIPVTLTPETDPAVVSFIAPSFKGKQSPELVFQLTVTDDQGMEDSDLKLVTVLRNMKK
ncbi:FG-GAP repeat domain-containing protein [Desulforhopalus sp. 52FAK]